MRAERINVAELDFNAPSEKKTREREKNGKERVYIYRMPFCLRFQDTSLNVNLKENVQVHD